MIAWIDGALVHDAAALTITGPAFRCGMGLFETMLHHGQALPRFERHLERLEASLDALRIAPHGPPPILADREALRRIVLEVARSNGLAEKTARVNLFCYQDTPGAHASLCVAVAPHAVAPDQACRLEIYPSVHVSHLCAHKTMANLHQRLAWDHARRSGCDDAALLDSAGFILESAVGALLFSDGRGFFTSRTPYKLPSLTLEAASQLLGVEEIPVTLADAANFRHAYRLNSLIGIQPVTAIGDARFEPDWSTCKPLLRELLGEKEET